MAHLNVGIQPLADGRHQEPSPSLWLTCSIDHGVHHFLGLLSVHVCHMLHRNALPAWKNGILSIIVSTVCRGTELKLQAPCFPWSQPPFKARPVQWAAEICNVCSIHPRLPNRHHQRGWWPSNSGVPINQNQTLLL